MSCVRGPVYAKANIGPECVLRYEYIIRAENVALLRVYIWSGAKLVTAPLFFLDETAFQMEAPQVPVASFGAVLQFELVIMDETFALSRAECVHSW